MTQDEIIRMAREAGLAEWHESVQQHGFKFADLNNLERFAALVAAHEAERWKVENNRDYENWKMAAEKSAECEREACAKMCDTEDVHRGNWYAAAIRARGDK